MQPFFAFFLFLFSLTSWAQRPLSLQEAEELLQKNNLFLLSEQFNVTAAQASVIQAKIWEQPYLFSEWNAFNPSVSRVFDVGSRGQKTLAVQQLIYLGGKKKNEILNAQGHAALAQLEFEQLLRNLRFQLQNLFYQVHFDQQNVKNLSHQIDIIDTLISQYKIQVQKGNIPLRELVRLQSLVLNLKNERNRIQQAILENVPKISLLTGLSEEVEPQVDEEEVLQKFQTIRTTKADLLNITLDKNVDYQIALKVADNQSVYLKWQKSLQVPDLTAGLSYDQRGGAFNNQINFTLGIPLPLWSKNRGNIQVAQAQLNQSLISQNFKKMDLQWQVESYLKQWELQTQLYQQMDQSMEKNLSTIYQGTVTNFQKSNITMLEFTDFMESYYVSCNQLNELKKSFILAGLNLNYISNHENFN